MGGGDSHLLYGRVYGEKRVHFLIPSPTEKKAFSVTLKNTETPPIIFISCMGEYTEKKEFIFSFLPLLKKSISRYTKSIRTVTCKVMGDPKKCLEANLSLLMKDIQYYRSLLAGEKDPEISDEAIVTVTRELDVIRQNIKDTMKPLLGKGGEKDDAGEMVKNLLIFKR